MLRELVRRIAGRAAALGAGAANRGPRGRFRRVPIVRQHDATDCGAACLCAVAAYYGRRAPIALVRQHAGTDRQGTTVLGLLAAAARLGFAAKGVRGPLASLDRVPLPAVAHVAVRDAGRHYVVVERVSARHVTVMDPADGRRHWVGRDEFGRRWTGVLVLLADHPPAADEAGDAPARRGGGGGRGGHADASTARRLLRLLRPHRAVLAQALAGALAYTLLGLSTSVYVQKIVDHVLVDGNRNLLNVMSVAMVALLVVQGYLGAAKSALTLRTGQRIDGALVTGYYGHLLHLPQRFFDTMRVGEVTARLNDAVKIRAFINDVALELVVSALVVGLSLALMAAYAPPLALLTAAVAPCFALIYWTSDRLSRGNQRRLMERAADLESQVVESVTAIATVKRLGVEWFAGLQTETRFVRLLRAVRASAQASIWTGAATELTSRLATVALLWVGAGLVIDRAVTPGELMSCYALLGHLTGPVARLIGMNKLMRDALIAADRLFEITDLEREDGAARLELTPELCGDVQFAGVSVRYGARPRVLADVTFTAPRGMLTAVVGESGSGKSTLAAVLQRVYPLDGGSVRVGEHDVAHVGLASLRRVVGVVPQRVDLFAGTVLENIALGDFEPDMQRVVAVCRQLGLLELVGSLPHGFDTHVGEHGAALSGGQRQRLAIARALYRDPAVLVLDEATAALDSIAERVVQRAVRELTRAGTTVIVIAHRLSTVVHADNIVVLEGGRVAEQGSHAELLRRGGVYARLWAHQFGGSHAELVVPAA